MMHSEIRARIQAIRIRTKRLMTGAPVGDFSTARQGFGFEFKQLREYQEGDDIRFIDWKSTAKTKTVFVRQYTEEKQRTLWLLVDRSSSTWYGSKTVLKYQIQAEAALAIAFAAEHENDSVGLILFDEGASVAVPLGKGRRHTQKIAEKLFSLLEEPVVARTLGTDFSLLFDLVAQSVGKKSICFLLSDYRGFTQEHAQKLALLGQRSTVACLRVGDPVEKKFPEGIVLSLEDPETGELLECSSSDIGAALGEYWHKQERVMQALRATVVDLSTAEQVIENVVRLFKRTLQ